MGWRDELARWPLAAEMQAKVDELFDDEGDTGEAEEVMENPSTWKRTEKVIADAHREWSKASRRGVFGLSLPAAIATRLREAGIVNDADEPALGWEGLGESAEATRRPRERQAGDAETREHMKRWADGGETHRGEDSGERAR